LAATNKTPFARIKTVFANLTYDEARAKGYITGNRKKEEIIPLLKRVTAPTTIYKKQKLDRDDEYDITEMRIVAWLKKEMRTMLNEELARAILIGDGRDISDEDKVNEQCIRPIASDDPDLFVHRLMIPENAKPAAIIDEVIRAKKHYKGSGKPTFYTTTDLITELLLIKDLNQRDIYDDTIELAKKLRVKDVEEVEVMDTATLTIGNDTFNVLGIIVNLKDYTVRSNNGGQINMFDDFDIDYNQLKYLIETRCSGALTRYKSAIVILQRRAQG